MAVSSSLRRPPRGSDSCRCTTTISSAWSAFRAPVPRRRPRSGLPRSQVAQLVRRGPKSMRVPPNWSRKKKPPFRREAPKVTLAAKKENLCRREAGIPGPRLKQSCSPTGSSHAHHGAAPQKVQLAASAIPTASWIRSSRRPVQIRKQARSICLRPRHHATARRSHGAKGSVATLVWSGVATGNSSSGISGSRGAVRQGGFGDADVVAAAQPRPSPPTSRQDRARPKSLQAPSGYTDEAGK